MRRDACKCTWLDHGENQDTHGSLGFLSCRYSLVKEFRL